MTTPTHRTSPGPSPGALAHGLHPIEVPRNDTHAPALQVSATETRPAAARTATGPVLEPAAAPPAPAPAKVSIGVWLAAIFVLALGIRIAVDLRPGRLIDRDGVRYAKLAQALARGEV